MFRSPLNLGPMRLALGLALLFILSCAPRATVDFPPGSVEPEQITEMRITEEDSIARLFKEHGQAYGVSKPLWYETRINTGVVPPQKPVDIRLPIPGTFGRFLKPGESIQVFAVSNESLVRIPSDVDEDKKFASVKLPAYYFDSSNSRDGTYEAVVTLARAFY